jgi:hypothetical protein
MARIALGHGDLERERAFPGVTVFTAPLSGMGFFCIASVGGLWDRFIASDPLLFVGSERFPYLEMWSSRV